MNIQNFQMFMSIRPLDISKCFSGLTQSILRFLQPLSYYLNFKNDCICKELVTGKPGKSLIYEKEFHFQKNLPTHAFTETTTFDFKCKYD